MTPAQALLAHEQARRVSQGRGAARIFGYIADVEQIAPDYALVAWEHGEVAVVPVKDLATAKGKPPPLPASFPRMPPATVDPTISAPTISINRRLDYPVQIRLSAATRDALRDLADAQGQTLAGMARVLIMQGLIRRRARAKASDRYADTPRLP